LGGQEAASSGDEAEKQIRAVPYRFLCVTIRWQWASLLHADVTEKKTGSSEMRLAGEPYSGFLLSPGSPAKGNATTRAAFLQWQEAAFCLAMSPRDTRCYLFGVAYFDRSCHPPVVS